MRAYQVVSRVLQQFPSFKPQHQPKSITEIAKLNTNWKQPIQQYKQFYRSFHTNLGMFAGHSHWHNIMHQKKRSDLQKMRNYTKLQREISVAAKLGGTDPDSNPRLAVALSRARLYNLPKDNLESALYGSDKSAGTFEEIIYEGFGPGGVAVLLESLTDNKHRAAQSLRYIFAKYGNFAGNGSVKWMFDKKGVIVFDSKSLKEDDLVELALELGAEDIVLGQEQNANQAQVPSVLL